MRIALYSDPVSTGRNDGNPLYVTACLKRLEIYTKTLRGLPVDQGTVNQWLPKTDDAAKAYAMDFVAKYNDHIEIDHLAPYKDLKHDFLYDWHIWVDWGEDGLKGILPEDPMPCPKPMVYWASDTHIQTPHSDSYPYRLGMAKQADIAFAAQRRGQSDFMRDGVHNPIFLPHAVEPLAYPKQLLHTKKYDVCFVGHVNNEKRLAALDRLFKEFPNFYYGQRRFEDAAQKYGESKIVFNISMSDDLVMRVFEAMATRSLLLTNWIPTIEELFTDGKHLVLYRNEAEMVEKASYYLEHEDERNAIAEAGYQEVIKKHTILERVKVMLGEMMVKKTASRATS